MTTIKNLEYLNIQQFDSPDLPGSSVNMDLEFLYKLNAVGGVLGKRLIVTSGYRTKVHNVKVKGSNNSSHLRGLGADVVCLSGRDKWHFITACMSVGLTRFGVGKSFVHVDCDKSLPSKVFFCY